MTHPSSGASRLVEANMRRWLERDKLDDKISKPQGPKFGPFVAISRQCGTGGARIAALLAEKLGWDLVDRKIVEDIAKDFNVSTQLVELVDERHVAWLTEMFSTWIEGQSFSQEGYVQDLSKLLMIAAQHGDFVMVGRGCQFILPRDYGLIVRLHAPLEHRVTNIVQSKQMTKKEAEAYVVKVDKEREKYLKTYFRNNGADEKYYDLVIDTSRFELEAAADMIEMATKSVKTKKL